MAILSLIHYSSNARIVIVNEEFIAVVVTVVKESLYSDFI